MNEAILHAAFIPFGDIKDVKTPLDHATQKHRSFGFVTFLGREDASAAMDNIDGAALYGRSSLLITLFLRKLRVVNRVGLLSQVSFLCSLPNLTFQNKLFTSGMKWI